IDEVLKESEMGDVLNLIEGTTTESIGQLQEEIDFFLSEESDTMEETKRASSSKDQSNPFTAIVGGYSKKTAPKEKKKTIGGEEEKIFVRKDNWVEKNLLRKVAGNGAKDTIFEIFDVFKKAYGMASFT
ncbi:hypothetical protein ACFLZJ_00605, partial [Nanoarchaeota archaeon]